MTDEMSLFSRVKHSFTRASAANSATNESEESGSPTRSTKQLFRISPQPSAGLVGFDNLGNSCYMNSALQCLMATTKLTEFFLLGLYREDINEDNCLGTGGLLAVKFGHLCESVWRPTVDHLAPRSLKDVMDKFAPQFKGFDQHDSQEFISFLLDGLHEDLNRVQKRPYLLEPDINRETLRANTEEHMAAEAWCRHLYRNRSYLVDSFQGQMLSQIECCRCRELSLKFEPFMYLSLPTKMFAGGTVKSIDDALKAFLAPEELKGENSWRCPKCKKNVTAIKRFYLLKLPPVLIIHLKRFDVSLGVFKKLRAFIDFPIENVSFEEFLTQNQKQPPIYDVYGIINHSGQAQYGHYTATCYHGPTDSWYVFDDASVVNIDKSQVVTENCYVAFFKRKDVSLNGRELMKRQTLGKPEDWPHFLRTRSINDILSKYISR